MEDSIIIWKFLARAYPDDHPVIYLYVCGNVRSPQRAIDSVMKVARIIFPLPISKAYLLTSVKGFLDMKKKQYLKGLITVKPIY